MAPEGGGAEDGAGFIHRLPDEGAPKPMRGRAKTAPLIGASGADAGGEGGGGAVAATGTVAARAFDMIRARGSADGRADRGVAATCDGLIGCCAAAAGSTRIATLCAYGAGAFFKVPAPFHVVARTRAWASTAAVAADARRALCGMSGGQNFTSPWITRGASVTSGFAPM